MNDKVIVTENNYDLDVMNGDIGIIIGLKEKDIIIRFEDGKEVEFSSKSMEKVELAYAITIHKSQGSEYRAVVIPISANHSHMLTRKLIYTAITRGKEIVCLVGQCNISACIKNVRKILDIPICTVYSKKIKKDSTKQIFLHIYVVVLY